MADCLAALDYFDHGILFAGVLIAALGIGMILVTAATRGGDNGAENCNER